MAKSDSFFIRAKTDFNGTTFAQTAIDLGAYVDALGKSVLRVHNVQVRWGGELNAMTTTIDTNAALGYQLTTQSQTAMVNMTDKSLISSGRFLVSTPNTGFPTAVTDVQDLSPQEWTNGYLVGVEQIYLGVDSTVANNLNLDACQVVLECTVETLSQSAAMALALSQQ
jgi:hypothetical protein